MRKFSRFLPTAVLSHNQPRRRRRPGRRWDAMALEERLLLSTFTVTNTLDDTNPGSLRWAIGQVDADTGTATDTIRFAIPGTGPFTISPASSYPTITHPVVIDGYTESGSSRNTLAQGDNAVLKIVLNGANSGGDGLAIAAGGSTVRGLVIQQFGNAIHLMGPGGDVVSGNFLGLDATGQTASGSYEGVFVDGSNGNTIGGATPAARNVISSNQYNNILIVNGSTGNLVAGNFIGLAASGTSAVRGISFGNGIFIYYSPGNTVGGTSAAARNVVAGQPEDGIEDDNSGTTLIQGNFVGTDVTGTVALPNAVGIAASYSASNDTIGGTATGAGNLVSGNSGAGILVSGSDLVAGNVVGTDVTETKALGNLGAGIEVSGSNNTIGGTTAGASNLVSANGIGVLFDSGTGSGNALLGNHIGTGSTASTALGNTSDGVEFNGSSGINTVGGTASAAGNVIANNGGSGIGITANPYFATVGVEILANSIFGNGGLGIDLGDDGVTPNAPGGPRSGPNELQNYPILGSSVTYGGRTYVKASLAGTPNSTYTIQFYSDPTADPSGHGEGQSYLGSLSVTTDATGNAIFLENLPGVVPAGTVITATATDQAGDTSEFAADTAVVASPGPLYAQSDTYVVDQGTLLLVNAPGVQANDIAAKGETVTSNVVTQPAHGTVTLGSNGAFAYNPAAGFTGVDSFTYDDVQGGVTSNVATVTIDVVPQTLIVTNTNDSGPGSLRQAILTADTSTGANTETILFQIPGTGPFVISPQTPLPALTEPTVVNGYSQRGSKANTLKQGDNAVILIEIQGGGSSSNGLEVSGGSSTVKGLQITGFANGFQLDGSGGDTVTGNILSGNSNDGIFVTGASANVIGGTAVAARNLESGNRNAGIALNNSASDVIQGNYSGTNAAGTASGGYQNYGIDSTNSPNATIGGTAAGAGNLLSGNVGNGAFFDFGSGSATVQGNLIGTDVTGTVAVANGGGLNTFADNMLIGGKGTTAGNVISGNTGNGLDLDGTGDYADAGNVVQGNRIGVDITGTRALGNTGNGLILSYTSVAMILGNVISANGGYGIWAFSEGYGGDVIQGNEIGTDATGTVALGNASGGIIIADQNVLIGGTKSGQGNIISGNFGDGIYISGGNGASNGNVVQGNRIGTDATGTIALGNTGRGVLIGYQSALNQIGGTAPGAANVIADNELAGVAIVANYIPSDRNPILSNSIYGNGGLGIDLGDDGVTPNHDGGPTPPGPNDNENFPVLTSATEVDGKTVISGTLNSAASTTYTIQFFSNPTADPSGHGQGRTYLGSIQVTTDASGNVTFTETLSASVPTGQVVTATATDPTGNTSEFALDTTVGATGASMAIGKEPTFQAPKPLATSITGVPGLAEDFLPIAIWAMPDDDSFLSSLAENIIRSKAKHKQAQ